MLQPDAAPRRDRDSVEPRANIRSVTGELARRIGNLRFDDLPQEVVHAATQCLLDWIGVSLAARDEPLVEILHRIAAEEGGKEQASVLGRGRLVSAPQAALINGAMGHALDYDDVNDMGHPTAPVAPAVLALGEAIGCSGARLIEAFVAGYETEIRIGRYVGRSHYFRGWHSTATVGTFGATAASAKILGLDAQQIAHAFGIAGTQAAGLKAVFGTMCKPYHAGHAARTGVEAARMAQLGFTSSPAILEAHQGFAYTQSNETDEMAALAEPASGYHILTNLYKYHAACYMTHSSIEAIRDLRARAAVNPDNIARLTLAVDPLLLDVCDIADPHTGLECKFSIRTLAALALLGEDTANESLYSDATAGRPDLAALRSRIDIDPSSTNTLARVTVELDDGRRLEAEHDVGVPVRDLNAQQQRLEDKFRRIVSGSFDHASIIAKIRNLPAAQNIDGLMELIGRTVTTTP